MSDLNKFFQNTPDAEKLIGTYLYPYRLLSEPDWNDPFSATAIISTTKVDDQDIYITLNGGLFLKLPSTLTETDIERKIEFEEKAANSFNRLVCEFAFHGLVSEPATPVHISAGKLIDGHVLIIGTSGGRELYAEKTMNPSMHLIQGTWKTYQLCDPTLISQVIRQERSSIMAKVSSTLPGLIAGAYSLFSRRQLSEALIDSWIVIEQLLDWYWSNHISQIENKKRKDRLADTRTYSSAVRIEILYSIGVISTTLYEALNVARKHRNNLAHRAVINIEMASETARAMQQMIEFFGGYEIEPLLSNDGVNW